MYSTYGHVILHACIWAYPKQRWFAMRPKAFQSSALNGGCIHELSISLWTTKVKVLIIHYIM